MNWLDIVIIVGLIIPVFTGLKQGLIKAAVTMAGLIVGVVLAGNFHQELADLLTFIDNPSIAGVVAYVIILAVVLGIAGVIATFLRAAAKAVLLGWVDKLGGGILGFLTGAITMGALLATVVKFFGEGIVTESFLAAILLDKFPLVLGLLPSEFDAIRDFFD